MTRQQRFARGRQMLCGTGALITFLACVPSARAADEHDAQAGTQDAVLSEIVVTASRAARNGVTAPTPTTTIGAADLKSSGLTNVADLLNTQIPSFRSTTSPTASTLKGFGGGNYLDLRGLGSARTLVLVDGRRHVSTGATGSVNIDVVPQSLLERVEVVTGGASAAWGSDAVSGVVNLIFRKKLDGLEGQVRFGRSGHGDGTERIGSLAYGTGFAADRGQLMIAVESVNNLGVSDQGSRSWGRADWQLMTNPAYAVGNGQPLRLIVPNVHPSNASYGSLITSPDTLAHIQFTPDGQPVAFAPGSLVGSVAQVGGSGVNPGRFNQLSIPDKRNTVFARSSFELNDSVTTFAELSYADSHNVFDVLPTFDFGSIIIQRDNAYLPASIAAQMVPGSQLRLGRINADFGYIVADNEDRTARAVAGLRGKFGASWDWNVYYEHGRDRNIGLRRNNRVEARFKLAADAVFDPITGKAICRSSLTAPNNGCVPLDLFGEGSPSADALGYFMATSNTTTTITQNVVAADLRGEPFSTWASPISVGLGGEYRSEAVAVQVDDISASGGFFTNNSLPYNGRIEVEEAFAETIVPLLRNWPGAKSLDLNGAIRRTHYNTSGGVDTWKLGGVYEPVAGLILRATLSRDIRAPNATELFSAGTSGLATLIEPRDGTQKLVSVLSGGNRALHEETARTKTLGFSVAPAFVPGVEASVDYYDISIDGAIGALAAQSIVDRCSAGANSLCAFVQRDPVSQALTTVSASVVNVNRIETRGEDFELGYRFRLASLVDRWRGGLAVRALLTHVNELLTDDGVTRKDVAGSLNPKLGGVPSWRSTLSVSYDSGPLDLYTAARYVGSGKYDKDFGPLDINDNDVPSAVYVDLSAQYRLTATEHSQLTLIGAVRNAFDRAPPVDPTPDFVATPTNTSFYDVIGRYFSLGVKFEY